MEWAEEGVDSQGYQVVKLSGSSKLKLDPAEGKYLDARGMKPFGSVK
jgi:hypothetical protein